MQLPLDLCRRRGVQDHCNETEEATGSPAQEKAMGDITPGEHPLGCSLLGNRVPNYRPTRTPGGIRRPNHGRMVAPAVPGVPVARAGAAGLTSAELPGAGPVPPAQDMAHGAGTRSPLGSERGPAQGETGTGIRNSHG